MDDLTLVIPAKNEKESLPKVLGELKKYNLKIIIVLEKNDFTTINSIKNYKYQVIYQTNNGYGDAIILGINSVQTNFFCIFNADGSFNPNEIQQMYNIAKSKKADFIFGSRYVANSGSEDDTIVTYIGNKLFTFLGNFFFSLQISDILYTFVLGDTKKAKLLNLKCKDFSFCVELPIKAKRAANKLISTPSFERPRIGGIKKVNAFRDGFFILIRLIKLYFS